MQNKTVYIIDDEPALLELLADVVELCNMQAKAFLRAEDFFAGVQQFEAASILVLDLHMPGMDGIEVMRRLAKLPNPPALILISGYDKGILHSAEELGKAHNLKILASLEKPISIEAFQAIIQEQLPLDRGRQGSPIQHDAGLHGELKTAIQEDQLYLEYQPQYDLASQKIIGAEALLRWAHPVRGMLPPSSFIPLAEKNGFIKEITHCVIDKAVEQGRTWEGMGLPLKLSINVSAIDISSLTLPEQLTDILANRQIQPEKITLEITESSLMGELATSLDILTRLRLKGIGLSIDDFGTGYSSLSQLHRIPFTELKVDRSFVSNMHTDPEASAIVKTCIMLGKELNMKVVAEGVEQQEHIDMLKELNCDIVQGFYLSRPLPAEALTDLLKKNQA